MDMVIKCSRRILQKLPDTHSLQSVTSALIGLRRFSHCWASLGSRKAERKMRMPCQDRQTLEVEGGNVVFQHLLVELLSICLIVILLVDTCRLGSYPLSLCLSQGYVSKIQPRPGWVQGIWG